jgi:drug/metabolite transporter (DMT)-like permease
MTDEVYAPPVAATPKHTAIWGYLAAGSGAALFSTKAIFVKLAYAEGVDAGTFLAIRMVFAAPIFALVGWWAWRRRAAMIAPRVLWATLGVGALGYYGASWLDFWGLEYISANLERVILLTYPMFVIFLGALFFKTPIRAHALGAAVLSYLGLAVLLTFGHEAQNKSENLAFGASLVLLSGVAYALYQLFAKDLISELGGALFTALAMLSAGGAVLLHFALTHPLDALAAGPKVLSLGLMVAFFSTVLPSFLISLGIKHAGSQATAIIGTISPLITIVLAVAVLRESFGWTDAIGSALVVGPVAFFTYWDMRLKAKPAA